jgi:hypothetical protein
MTALKLLKALFIQVLLTCLLMVSTHGQSPARHTISGYVYEKGSKETLIGVNIYAPALRIGAITNTYGFYALTLPADSVELYFTYVGYQIESRSLALTGNLRMDIELIPIVELGEVVVRDERINRISQSVQMSRLDVPIHQARNIPTLLGEKDMLKVIQLMPGVQSGNEGTSGFYVRGGGPDQNLIILDDAIVYNASHLFGFFSVFNGDAIKNMQLYKGGFPARFGGRLSSVLDIQMRDGNKEKFAGEAGIGLISSRLTLEGPIVKDKASFLISGRRTYVDALMRPFMLEDVNGGYFFYDLNAKLNYDINPNNRIFVSAYLGRDKFYFRDKYKDGQREEKYEGGFYWQNRTATLRWNHLFNNNLFANASLIFSDYELKLYNQATAFDRITKERSKFELSYNSGIHDIGGKYDISWHPHPNHHVKGGIQTIYHTFTPSALVSRDDEINLMEKDAEYHYSWESGIYVEDEIRYGDRITLNPGLRLSHFITGNKTHHYWEPRLASNFLLAPGLSWKASYAKMSQYVHLLSTTGIGLPTDLWVPSTERIKPQKTWQTATGFAYDWLNRNLELSIEGYYKKSDQIIAYKEGASFLFLEDIMDNPEFSWQDNITNGQSWAYGLEFLIQRKSGRFSGWAGYTLSWIQHQFDELNFGEKFWARYDRRHDISLVGIYEIKPKITLSATWVYATGNAYDLATGTFPVYEHGDGMWNSGNFGHNFGWYSNANVYDKKNNFRASSYQRLDVGLQFHKEFTSFGNSVKRTIEIGAYNAYNRQNPFFYFWDDRYDGMDWDNRQSVLKQFNLFPIIPSISLNFSF